MIGLELVVPFVETAPSKVWVSVGVRLKRNLLLAYTRNQPIRRSIYACNHDSVLEDDSQKQTLMDAS